MVSCKPLNGGTLTYCDLVTPHGQCLKLMVAQSPLATINWAEPVKFNPGQVKKYNRLYKEGNFLNISGWLKENFRLKHCMVLEILVKTGSGNGLLPDGTKPLLRTNVHLPSTRSSDIHSRELLIWILSISITKLCLKFTHLKSQPHLLGPMS